MRPGLADRPRPEEEERLEEGVREQVEDRRHPGADAERHHHVAQLADGRVREHLLDVALHEREHRSDDDRHAADECHRVQAAVADREAAEEDGVEAGAEVHARDHHGGGVDERRDGRRARHGVGQPGVQRELAALADDPDEQARRAHDEQRVADAAVERFGVDHPDVEGAGAEEQDDDADHEADVAGASREERLDGGVGVRLLLPPVADEHEGAHADELPGHE